jgi:CRISPR type I-E-associated protein CasB/Cse2
MKDDQGLAQACLIWWQELSSRPGDRAALRRAGSVTDALMVPSTHRLADRVRAAGLRSPRRAALLAALLSQARSCDLDGEPLPARLGQRHDDRAMFSESRFRRLLRSSDEDDLLLQLRRAIRMLDGRIHLPSLAEAIRFWSFDPGRGASTITDWACDYYAKAPPLKSS